MKTTPFTDDLFIGRNYQQNNHSDCGLHSSYDRHLVSIAHGRHSLLNGQARETGGMLKEELKALREARNVQRFAVKLPEKICQVEKVAGQQGRRAMLDHQKTYEEELRAQLQEWEEQVGLYRAKAESATDLAREEFHEITAALQRMQDETRMKLQELRRAGNEDLTDTNNDAENACSEVRGGFSNHVSCSQVRSTSRQD